MNFDHLADFIAALEDDADLVRIAAPVDPVFEIAEITTRICQLPGGGPALLFENVKGHAIPVVTNLLGSSARMCKALRAESLEQAAGRVAALVHPALPEDWLHTLKLVPQVAHLMTTLPPRAVKTGLCQQVVHLGRDVNLAELPIPHAWPEEAAPTITAGQVFTQHPQSRVRNVGRYPLEVRGRDSLRVHWDMHQGGFRNYTAYRERNQQMPVAVALGGDPVYPYMASAPLPANTDECLFGGFLRGKNIDLVKCRSIELEVPAEAEIVLEGYIDPSAPLETSGPIATATGHYAISQAQPVMQVTAVTRRANPIFPAIIVGAPPTEDYWLGKATERLFLPLVKMVAPELIDLNMPRAGVFRHLLFVSIRKQYPQQARKVMNVLWSLDWLMTAKIIVVVDADVDVHNEEQVWLRVGNNVHPGRDVVFCEGPTHVHDHAAPCRGVGHKMGFDATQKLPEEGHPRPWPAMLAANANIRDLVNGRWHEYGLERPQS
jgi:4-hydroxy-3-polyprenylbenzoate decarboxylase